MMIFTAKIPKKRLIAIGLLLLFAIVLIVMLFGGAEKQTEVSAQQDAAEVRTNEDRIAFLAQYGWEVGEEPVKTQQVRIPTEDSEVFSRYNELQRSQGYDLEQYAGKSICRYVYEITNYPEQGLYYATLLVYKNEVIGGDVCCADKGGIMHGLSLPKG